MEKEILYFLTMSFRLLYNFVIKEWISALEVGKEETHATNCHQQVFDIVGRDRENNY